MPGQKLKPRHSAYPKGIGGEAPAWVAFDRQVSLYKIVKGKNTCKISFNMSLIFVKKLKWMVASVDVVGQ